MVREHGQPLEDLFECYRITYGDEAVNDALRKLGDRMVADHMRRTAG